MYIKTPRPVENMKYANNRWIKMGDLSDKVLALALAMCVAAGAPVGPPSDS
jgi:hypothetical protein